MIKHIVQFNLKPEVDASDRDRLFQQIKSMAKLPSVNALHIGRLLEPNEEWYIARLNKEYLWALIMDFNTEADLYNYQKCAQHEVVAAELRKRVDGLLRIVDFVSQ